MPRVRTVLSAVVLAVACAAGTVLTAGPAGAADRPSVPLTAAGTADAESFTVTLTRSADASFGAQEVITCGGSVTNPYVTGGKVRADIKVSCDGVLDTIEVGVAIEINGALGPDSWKGLPKVTALNHDVTTPCPGTTAVYRSAGVAIFTKAGYVGSPLTLAGKSPRISLAC